MLELKLGEIFEYQIARNGVIVKDQAIGRPPLNKTVEEVTMIYYQIKMKNEEGTMYSVSADPNNHGKVFLAMDNADDAYQLWEISYVPSEWNVGLAIINKQLGSLAVVGSENHVVLASIPENGSIPGNKSWQVNTLGDGLHSIMPLLNENLALNARGNEWEEGTEIIVFPWDGGQHNEEWFLIPTAVPASVASM